MNIIAIDPSINDIGLAILYQNGERYCTTLHSDGETEFEKAKDIAEYFRGQSRIKPLKIIIETPNSWTREGQNVSSLQKLSLAIGAIIGGLCDCEIEPVKVKDWKGKQSKITPEFFAAAYPEWPAKNEHERDAAMMLEWWLAKTRIKRG